MYIQIEFINNIINIFKKDHKNLKIFKNGEKLIKPK